MATIRFRDPATGEYYLVEIGGAGHVIQDEGSTLTARSKLNFVGSTVTATDDAANDRTVVTIAGASAPARQSTGITTTSIADGAMTTGTVTLSKSYRLIRIVTDRPARVRLYTTSAKRDADSPRTAGSMPTGDHGLVVDLVTTSGDLDWDLSPVVDGSDGKTTPNGSIPYIVTNMSGVTSTVTATLYWIATE